MKNKIIVTGGNAEEAANAITANIANSDILVYSLSEEEYQEKKKDYYNLLNKKSKVVSFKPCEGTLVKTNRKEAPYQLVAYKATFKAPRKTSSTKVGAGNGVATGRIYRFGKFKPQMLTILAIMRMTIQERKQANVSIDTFSRKLRKVKKI